MNTSASAAPVYIAGVPHPLPAGERLLWQGSPDVRATARHVFHQRALALYFAAMLAVWAMLTPLAFASAEFTAGLGLRVALVLLALGVVEALARIVARTTTYAVTDKRIVLRIGMVIPMSINVPFALLSAAAVGKFRDGTGQVALSLEKPHRIAYIALWPHCRVFSFNQPSPVLRGLLDPATVGELLANAVAAAEQADGTQSLPHAGQGTEPVVDRAPVRSMAMV